MQHIALVLFALYATLVGLMYIFQRKLMYLPSQQIERPEHYGLQGFQDITATTSDNVRIQLWYRPAAEGFPTVVYCHGNAGHIGDRAAILGALASKGFGVLGVSYRGYGKSTDRPSEQGLYRDARAAITFLNTTQAIPLSKMLLFGESLGTGVATQIATEFSIGGLVLQAPYTSVAGRAAEMYYYIPVKWLIIDKYESLRKIGNVSAPLLIFHGERDDVIPIAHGKALFDAAVSAKRAFFMPQVAHNDFDSEAISAHVLDFAKEHMLVH